MAQFVNAPRDQALNAGKQAGTVHGAFSLSRLPGSGLLHTRISLYMTTGAHLKSNAILSHFEQLNMGAPVILCGIH